MRIALILAVTFAGVAAGGVLQLRDGQRVEGELKRSGSGWEVTSADGKLRVIPEADVVSIQTSAPSGESGGNDAAARLASLRRAVASMDDIPKILERYEQAMKQFAGTPTASEAQKDVQQWVDYQQKGMVKVGKEWLLPAAVAGLEAKNAEQIQQARQLLETGRPKDAAAALDQVLASDPENVSALYLKGLIAYRAEQIPAARRAFEQVAEKLPGHGPTLNNLAVTQWRQNATGIALTNFQRAMTAMPLNNVIHDNVAEALNMQAEDARETPQLRKLQSQFQMDEPKLQAQMQQSGWFRWGGTWVTQDQLEQVRAEEAQLKAELDELSADFDRTQREIDRIDDLIARNNEDLTQIENSRWARANDGQWAKMPVPNSWRRLDRENEDLKLRRKTEIDRLDRLRAEAKQVKSKVSRPQYTGQMRLMDEQFSPMKAPK